MTDISARDTRLRVDDLRPSELMVEWADRVAEDIAWLEARRDQFVDVACPACDSNDFVALYTKNGVPHVSCNSCGTQYANPRPSEDVLVEFYLRSSNYEYWAEKIYAASEAARREKLFKPRVAFVVKEAEKRGMSRPNLLEVGAGYGILCEEAVASGAFSKVIGVEPTKCLADVCRRKGLEVIESSYEALSPELKSDIIVCYEVIEHLQSPRKFMEWSYRTLVPGGFIVITCPCISGFETRVQGRNSGTIDHQHVNLFSTSSLAGLARNVGFETVEVETPGELDTELVRQSLERGDANVEVLGTFLESVLKSADDATVSAFQAFLRTARASSHMLVVAGKRA